MIGGDAQQSKLFKNGSLLEDLVNYVRQGKDCKLLFVGDAAQLPPIHSDRSPALDRFTMEKFYSDEVICTELSDVVRQAKDSGILYNATKIRKQIYREFFEAFEFQLTPFNDVIRLKSGEEMLEALQESYDEVGKEDSSVIVRSNKRATLYN